MSRILCYYQWSTIASQFELAMHDLFFLLSLFFPYNIPFGYEVPLFCLFGGGNIYLAFFTLPPLCDVHNYDFINGTSCVKIGLFYVVDHDF